MPGLWCPDADGGLIFSMVDWDRLGRWLGDKTPLAYSLPARELDEDFLSEARKDFEVMDGDLAAIEQTSRRAYRDAVEKGLGRGQAAYNIGVAAAAALSGSERVGARERVSYGVADTEQDGVKDFLRDVLFFSRRVTVKDLAEQGFDD
ncbi:MAG: hypothetical protein ABEJ07_04125 [Candidatus Nanohaloarchaea archaeon]